MQHPAILFVDKGSYSSRWNVFWFGVPCALGTYFIYQLPATLKTQLKALFDNIDEDQFEIYFAALFSLYTFVNIFLPFISGGLRDVLGNRALLITSLVQAIVGQIIFIYGLSTKSFLILYTGRIITGWGIETILPMQTAYLTSYFKKDYFSFSVSTFQMFGFFGIVLCMLYAPTLAEEQGVIKAFLIGLYILLFVTLGAIISVLLDRRAETEVVALEQYQEVPQAPVKEHAQEGQEKEEKIEEKKEDVKQEDVKQEDEIEVNQQQVDHMIQSEFYDKQGFFTSAFSLREIGAFPKLFWLIVLYYSLQFSSLISWMNISVEHFTETWLPNDSDAENTVVKIYAMMWLLSAILMPILGVFVDYVGHRSTLAIFAAIMCTISHILVMLYQPFIGLLLLGFGLSLSFSSVYTSVVYVIRIEQLGKAYSLMVAGLNIALTILPFSMGILRAYTKSSFSSQILLIFVSVLAFLVSVLIFFEDHKTGKRIDKGQMIIEDSDFISSMIDGRQGQSQLLQQDKDQEQVETIEKQEKN